MLTKYTISRQKFYLKKVMFHVCRMMQVLYRWQHHMTLTEYYHIYPRFKPIFHCDAKYLALGVGVGQCPPHQNFALEIPTCWYILALPNAKICVSPDAKLKICVSPDANPCVSQWHIGGVGPSGVGAGVGHVHFML